MELPEEVSMIDDTAPRFGPLVSTEWLERHLAGSSLRLADCRWYLGEADRGRREYDRGHLPGAVYVSLDDDLSAPEGPGRHPLHCRDRPSLC